MSDMRLIIAGSRHLKNKALVETYADRWVAVHGKPWLVLSGGARGADRYGEEWAREHAIQIMIYPAEWDQYGKAAGPRRNAEMVGNADAILAFWDGNEKSGTADVMRKAQGAGLNFTMVRIDEKDLLPE